MMHDDDDGGDHALEAYVAMILVSKGEPFAPAPLACWYTFLRFAVGMYFDLLILLTMVPFVQLDRYFAWGDSAIPGQLCRTHLNSGTEARAREGR